MSILCEKDKRLRGLLRRSSINDAAKPAEFHAAFAYSKLGGMTFALASTVPIRPLLSPTDTSSFGQASRLLVYELRFWHLHHNSKDDGWLLVHEMQASIERERDG
jgi:hypothetical protein